MFTTYRLTELHCGGIATRAMPHTAELQPETFVEISPELAAELGIANLEWSVLSTARGEIEAKTLVTQRLRPLTVNGRIWCIRSVCRGFLAGRDTLGVT